MFLDLIKGQVAEATQNLTVEELGELVDHFGDGTLEEIRNKPWQHHVSRLITINSHDRDVVHTLWAILTDVHSDRFGSECTRQ